ncbi:flotillin domain-containing protein, partial [Escherichia coli]
DRNRSHWSTSKTPSYTKSVSWQHHPIDGIKIIQVDGLNRGGAAGDANTGNVGGGNLAEQALSAALSYRTQAPLIDSLLNEIGVSGGSLAALTSPLTSTTPVEEKAE